MGFTFCGGRNEDRNKRVSSAGGRAAKDAARMSAGRSETFWGFGETCAAWLCSQIRVSEKRFFPRKGFSGPLFFSEEPPDHRGQATMLRHTQTNQAGCRRFPTWGKVGDGQDDTANFHVNNVSFPVFPRRPKTTPRRQDVWASCWVFRPCAQVFEAPGAINDGENMHPKVFPRQCQSPGNLLLLALIHPPAASARRSLFDARRNEST